MIAAYGSKSALLAPRLGNVDAVVTDLETLPQAYAEALRRRALGERFYGLLCADDSRVAYGYRHCADILDHVEDYDYRRMVLDQLALGVMSVNSVRVDTAWGSNADSDAVVAEFLGLSDAVLVRSYAEATRVIQLFATTFPSRPAPSTARILADSVVPTVPRTRPVAPAVVVWAPERTARECALALHGLLEFRGVVSCVSAGGPQPAFSPSLFLALGDPRLEAVLARANVVVCIEPNDPADAVAFARQGFGVVAPITSGAHEFAADVVVWDALDARPLFTCVSVALARPASVRAEPLRPPPRPQLPPLPAFVRPDELPLVSIVTPTYNRPGELRGMLACLAAQTYPNIEAVVVNDGGAPVGDVVAAFPFARLIDQPANFGALRAVEVGIAQARGTYIGLLPDDDRIYPDHVERIVYAMLRSGATIAHGQAFLRFLERDPRGGQALGDLVTVGFNNRTFSQTMTPTEALITATIGGQQFIAQRSAYETCGGYLLDSDVSDNEIHIRFTQRYFYAFIAHVTSEFRDHSGGQGRQCDFPAALRHVYENLHPVPDRPILEGHRAATIENIRRRPAGQPPFPMTIRVNFPSPASR